MAISYIGSASNSTTSLDSLTVNKPTGTSDDDIIFAQISHEYSSAPSTVPTGWTLVNSTYRSRLYYKIANSEPSDYTWEWSYTSYDVRVTNYTFRGGFLPWDPIADSESWNNGALGNTLETPGLDTVYDGAPMLFFGTKFGGSSSYPLDPPTNPGTWTEHVDDNELDGIRYYLYSYTWSSHGNTGDIEAQFDGVSTTNRAALSVSLNNGVAYTSGTGQSAVSTTGIGSWTKTVTASAGTGQSATASTHKGTDWIQYIPVPFDPDVGQLASATTGSGEWAQTHFYSPGSGQTLVATLGLSGYWTSPKPSVLLTTSTWHDKQLNIHSIGDDYGPDGVLVELCDNIDYDLAGTKTAQTLLYEDDDKITMLVDTTGFSDGDTAYLFVTNKYGSRSIYSAISIVDYPDPTLPNRYRLDGIHHIKDAWAVYNCTVFGHDSDGAYLWEKIDTDKDLVLGDGTDSGTYPTHTEVADGKDYYTFDGVNDHLSDWPDMPAVHTTLIGYSVSPHTVPTYQVAVDDTIETMLTTSGGFAGRLYNIIIFDYRLSDLEIDYVTDRMLRLL